MSQALLQIPAAPSGLDMRVQINQIVTALLTQNSGPMAPSVTYPGMWWGDTTANRLKRRSNDDTTWLNIGPLDDFLLDLRNAITANASAAAAAQTTANSASTAAATAQTTANSASTAAATAQATANSAQSTANGKIDNSLDAVISALGFKPVKQRTTGGTTSLGYDGAGLAATIDAENYGRVWTNRDASWSTSQNGYVKLPVIGIMLQWGYAGLLRSNSAQTIVFPVAFANACHAVYASGSDFMVKVSTIDRFSMGISSASSYNTYNYYLAIGY